MNYIIHGNNLEVMELLYQEGVRVNLHLWDPPYNNGHTSAYNDNQAQHDWETELRTAVELGHKLLAPSGILAVSISAVNLIPLGSICREIYGANNQLSIACWQFNTRFCGRMHMPTQACKLQNLRQCVKVSNNKF